MFQARTLLGTYRSTPLLLRKINIPGLNPSFCLVKPTLAPPWHPHGTPMHPHGMPWHPNAAPMASPWRPSAPHGIPMTSQCIPWHAGPTLSPKEYMCSRRGHLSELSGPPPLLLRKIHVPGPNPSFCLVKPTLAPPWHHHGIPVHPHGPHGITMASQCTPMACHGTPMRPMASPWHPSAHNEHDISYATNPLRGLTDI